MLARYAYMLWQCVHASEPAFQFSWVNFLTQAIFVSNPPFRAYGLGVVVRKCWYAHLDFQGGDLWWRHKPHHHHHHCSLLKVYIRNSWHEWVEAKIQLYNKLLNAVQYVEHLTLCVSACWQGHYSEERKLRALQLLDCVACTVHQCAVFGASYFAR